MKVKHILTLAAAALASSTAFAGTATLKNLDNPGGIANFTDFDWSSGGQIYITSYDVTSASPTGTSDTFTLQYQATATAVKANGVEVVGAASAGLNTTYEYTIFATLTETVTCILAGPAGPCSLATFTTNSGSFDVYYDTTPATFANYAAGTGFQDGTKLITGSITGGNTVVAPQAPSNPGPNSLSATIFGPITYTNLVYINPLLTASSTTTTLQFGGFPFQTQNFIRPAKFNGVTVGPDSNTAFIGQADGNTSFVVPEPEMVLLFGIGALGLGLNMRRRTKQA